MKKYIKDIVIIGILLTLVFFRAFNNGGCWVSTINFIGLGIVVYDLYSEVCSRNNNNDKLNTLHGLAAIIAVIFAIFLVLIGFQKIHTNNTFDDIILLITLMVSIPKQFYCYGISKWLGKKA